ncbi:MAG: sigma-70 family RNA polymerase sigma factor [Pseudomonadota bacterium]
MEQTEKQLIALAKGGNSAAYCELASQYRDQLFRFLWLRCGQRADAEDAVQEALLSAWRYINSYDERWQFSTWLYRIALRKLPDKRPIMTEVDNVGTPDDDIEQYLERANLWRAARTTLKPEALTALWLYYGEGASHREIAHALSRSLAWVKVNLMRSRNRLATVLGEKTG